MALLSMTTVCSTEPITSSRFTVEVLADLTLTFLCSSVLNPSAVTVRS